MDGARFDAFARSLAATRSRRSVLKNVGATMLGAAGLARIGAAEAGPACRQAGHPCEGNQTCCAGLVCMVSGPGAALRCTACPAGQIACGGVCIPACVASDQCHVVGVCDPAAHACTNPAATDGTTCDDGDACTQSDTCQAGVCTSGNPVVCTASDQCHIAGTCDPSTGTCSNPAAADGTGCSDGNACTTGDQCVSGACVPGSRVVCAPVGSLKTDEQVCNMTTGACDACPPHHHDCNGDPSDGCEIDTKTDVLHCGSCSTACGTMNGVASCSNGTCSIVCNPGFANCISSPDGCVTNLMTSKSNCGACGNHCVAPQTCQNGVCA